MWEEEEEEEDRIKERKLLYMIVNIIGCDLIMWWIYMIGSVNVFIILDLYYYWLDDIYLYYIINEDFFFFNW